MHGGAPMFYLASEISLKPTLLFLLALATVPLATGEPRVDPSEAIVANYCAASKSQAQLLKDASMDVDIDASLPKLKKQGKLSALRKISALGRITYEALKFEGDNTVKNQVITRYLAAESEAQKDDTPSMAVTPENYKFKYKGRVESDGHVAHIFEVTPKKKKQGLFKGEIWIDAATFLRVRESGRLVKNPSIFLKSVEFVRQYDIVDGIAVLRHVESTVTTRIAGKAELSISYSNFSLNSPRVMAVGETGGQ
jgi:hypothetical protein